MKPKDIALEFYKSDVLLNKPAVRELLHPEVTIDRNSSKGFIQMNFEDILSLSDKLSKAYIRSKIRIIHILQENDLVSLALFSFCKNL